MNIPRNFWNTLVTVLGLLVAFLAVLTIKEIKAIGYVGKSEQVVNTISVTGTGEAVAKPDIATFSFGVNETAVAVADAQTKASTKINAALKTVKDAGVDDKDVKTSSYSINPHYEYQDAPCMAGSICRGGKSVLTGYDVSQTIEVKVRDLSKAGALFQSIGALGVQNVNSLSFSVDKPEAVKAEARSQAISNAQDKAKELAKELGVTIVRVNSYYDQNDQPMPYAMGGDSMSFKTAVAPQANPAPDVPAGEQKVTSNVTITYEIR